MNDFTSLGLAAPLMKALGEEGYVNPTPIQSKAIPPVMTGRDLLGIAQTGTGKTAAFALPILHRLAADRRQPAPRGCRVLVLSPTRELASQIADSFSAYGRHMNLRVTVIFGGVGHVPQIRAMARGVDVLVATPGRLLDHMGERNVDLSHTEIFVLDEADQMLDLGFIKPIRQITGRLPSKRQNLFFSATMPREIAGLASELLRDPVRVEAAPVATTAERVAQRVVHVEQSKKLALLKQILSDPAVRRGLVFTRTKRGADRVARGLELAGFGVAAIHGNKSQRQREIALDGFRDGKIKLLIATDIAARGIDVDGVTHVVQYELPDVPEAYVHRIGRTARAGASGVAIALCDGAERDLLRQIERLTRQSIPSEDRRNDAALTVEPRAPRGRPERNGGRRDDRDDRDDRAPRHERPRAPAGERPHAARPHAARNGRTPPRGEGRFDARRDRPNDDRRRDEPRRDEPRRDERDDRRPAHADRRPAHADQRPARPPSGQRPEAARSGAGRRPAPQVRYGDRGSSR